MKKGTLLYSALLLVVIAISLCSWAPASNSVVTPPAPASGSFTLGVGPVWYTPTLSLSNTGADTATAKIAPGINNYLFQSLTYTVDMTLVSGTGAGKVKFWVSGVTGTPSSYQAIDSFTITNVTKQTWTKVVIGNPYTNYMVTVTGSGTESLSTVISLLER